MPLDNKNKGLRDLLMARGSGSKDAQGPSPLRCSPPPLPPPINVFTPIGLKKRKKDKKGIEGGVSPSEVRGFSSQEVEGDQG